MKEEKLDRIIRKTVNDQFTPNPSPNFVDNVMGELGVKQLKSTLNTKPLKPKKGLFLMAGLYLVILASIFFIPGTIESSSIELPQFKFPSLTDYFNISQGLSRMLIMLIIGGWILLFFDKYIKKLFVR